MCYKPHSTSALGTYSQIWRPSGAKYKDRAVYGTASPKGRGNLLPSHPGYNGFIRRGYLSTKLHGIAFQQTVILTLHTDSVKVTGNGTRQGCIKQNAYLTAKYSLKSRMHQALHFEFAIPISCNKRMATIRIFRAYEAAFNVGPAFHFYVAPALYRKACSC